MGQGTHLTGMYVCGEVGKHTHTDGAMYVEGAVHTRRCTWDLYVYSYVYMGAGECTRGDMYRTHAHQNIYVRETTRHMGLYIWGPYGNIHWGTQYTYGGCTCWDTYGGAYTYQGTYRWGPISGNHGDIHTTWGYIHGGAHTWTYMWEDSHQSLLGTPTRHPGWGAQKTPPHPTLLCHRSQQSFLYPFPLPSWERPVGFSLKFTVNRLCN